MAIKLSTKSTTCLGSLTAISSTVTRPWLKKNHSNSNKHDNYPCNSYLSHQKVLNIYSLARPLKDDYLNLSHLWSQILIVLQGWL